MKLRHLLFVLCCCSLAAATPPLEPMDIALNYAQLVVVGKLGPLTPVEASRFSATGEIAVTGVLKGPAGLESVTLTTIDPERATRQGGIDGGVIWPEGKEGIWILKKSQGQSTYFADNPAHVQHKEKESEIRRILRSLGDENTATTQPVERQGISLSLSFKPKVVGRGDESACRIASAAGEAGAGHEAGGSREAHR